MSARARKNKLSKEKQERAKQALEKKQVFLNIYITCIDHMLNCTTAQLLFLFNFSCIFYRYIVFIYFILFLDMFSQYVIYLYVCLFEFI